MATAAALAASAAAAALRATARAMARRCLVAVRATTRRWRVAVRARLLGATLGSKATRRRSREIGRSSSPDRSSPRLRGRSGGCWTTHCDECSYPGRPQQPQHSARTRRPYRVHSARTRRPYRVHTACTLRPHCAHAVPTLRVQVWQRPARAAGALLGDDTRSAARARGAVRARASDAGRAGRAAPEAGRA